jgi:uncharacterized delta-60 repeat protein
MKTISALILVSVTPIICSAALELRENEKVIERGTHYRVIETSRSEIKNGKRRDTKGLYTELANGMHYFEDGEWKESEESIELRPDGAAATQGFYKAFFSGNLLDEGVVELQLPGNRQQRFNVLGLTLQNAITGQEVVLATVKDCVGEVVGNNQVLYKDAFDGIEGDIRYTYLKGRFEQDVILHEDPILPQGFDPLSTLLRVVTEFSGPEPKQTEVKRKALGPGRDLIDSLLDFGEMVMIQGRAFSLDPLGKRDESETGVYKSWKAEKDRKLLYETVEYNDLKVLFQQLPKQRKPKARAGIEELNRRAKPPESGQLMRKRQVALRDTDLKAVVIDFITVASGSMNFSADQTYKVAGQFSINAGSVISGGAIIKYSTAVASSMTFLGSVTFPTYNARRAIFTHINDNRIGEPIGTSTAGTADAVGTSRYEFPFMVNSLASAIFQRMDIRFAKKGFKINTAGNFTVRNMIFDTCDVGVNAGPTSSTIVTFDRVLMVNFPPPQTFREGSAIFNNDGTQIQTTGSAPIITTQPQSETEFFSNEIVFWVTASGFCNFYQWYKDGVSIPGATDSSWKLYSLDRSKTGKYYVRIWNDFGSVKSVEVNATVQQQAPTIVTQPKSQTLPAGSSARFFVDAQGGDGITPGSFTYQWRKAGVNIAGATQFELIIPNAQASNAGSYTVSVTDTTVNQTISSSAAVLTIAAAANKTYNTTALFATGQRINLVAANNSLSPNIAAQPLPFLNVATSGRGTMTRVDVGSGAILGEYKTSPPEVGPIGVESPPDPSRTTVDKYGNIWVGNRRDSGGGNDIDGVSFFETPRRQLGSVSRFGLAVGGVRGRKGPTTTNPSGQPILPQFFPDIQGDYLKGPFTYNTCIDRDNDGLIHTSRGLGKIIPWGRAYDVTVIQNDVNLGGTYAWVADQDAGVRIVNVTDPTRPFEVTSWPASISGSPFGIFPMENNIYLASETGLRVVDVDDIFFPSFPEGTLTGEEVGGPKSFAVKVRGPSAQAKTAYVASVEGLRTFNVDVAGQITQLGAVQTSPQTAFDVEVLPWTPTRNRVAQLNADGTLDMNFVPDANSSVLGMILQPDGKPIIGGAFTTVNGATRGRIARLNSNGTLDTGFQNGLTGGNGTVNALARQSDGKIIVGGTFTTMNGFTRFRIARLNSDGTLDTAFQNGLAGADSTVTAITIQGDGKILVGGLFTTINGTIRNRIARLNSDGTLDTAFQNALTGVNSQLNAIALQTDGKIVLGGAFTTVNGATRNRIARLNSDGTLDTGFQNGLAGASGVVNSLLIQTDGQILIGGSFLLINGFNQPSLARLNGSDGTLDPGFIPPSITGATVLAMGFQSDSKIIVGGSFSTMDGSARDRIARLNTDGTLDQTFVGSVDSNINALVIRPDDRMVIAGLFIKYDSLAAYLATGSSVPDGSLKIIQVKYPSNPVLIGEISFTDRAYGVHVLNNLAYVANGDNGLRIVNIQNPSALTVVGTANTPLSGTAPLDKAFDVNVSGTSAFVADRDGGLRVISVSNPALPVEVAAVKTTSPALRVTVTNGKAYVAESYSGLDIIDVSIPSSPVRLGACGYAGDEARLNYTRVEETFVRHVSVDGNNDIWVGGTDKRVFQKISGITGLIQTSNGRFPVSGNGTLGGYGGFVDGEGAVWSATGSGIKEFLKMDPTTLTSTTVGGGFGIGDYGLAIDPANANIYITAVNESFVTVYNTGGTFLGNWHYGFTTAQGAVIDNNQNLWVAHQKGVSQTVGHLKLGIGWIGNVELGISRNLSEPVGTTGVAVDSSNKIWAANFDKSNLMRIDPNLGPISTSNHRVGAVDLTVDLDREFNQADGSAKPYNYSDMTGFVCLNSTSPGGAWVFAQDSGISGFAWKKLSWSATSPANTSVTIEARAADTEAALATKQFIVAVNNTDFTGMTGRFIEVRATFWRKWDTANIPVLTSLTVHVL